MCNNISRAINLEKDVEITVDYLPDIKSEDIEKFIITQKDNGKSVLYALKGMLPSKIANGIYEIINFSYFYFRHPYGIHSCHIAVFYFSLIIPDSFISFLPAPCNHCPAIASGSLFPAGR